MRLFTLFATAAMLVTAATSHASSFIGTTDAIGGSLVNTIEGTSDATSSIGNDKIVLDSREDAASFVASGGEIRGAHLQAALNHVRENMPGLQASDMELAEAILAL